MNIKWDEKYELHISGVDDQHKRLFQLLEESEKLYSNNNGNLINNMPAEIEQYSITHFLMEERAMEDTAYPDFETHKAPHLKFINTTQDFLLKLNTKEIINKGLCKSMIFSQSTLRPQRKESIKSILSVNSVPSVRDIFFVLHSPPNVQMKFAPELNVSP